MGQSAQKAQRAKKAAAVYGNVIADTQRSELQNDASDHPGCLSWYSSPVLFEAGNEPASVFVDLDDSQFAAADFLISLATAGERIKIIGKSSRSDLDQALHFSKLGVAEILPPDQCLTRLHEFLNELETSVETKPAKTSKLSREAIVGDSPQTHEIRATMEVLSQVDFPSALVLGETGTGKSLICKILHNSGQRATHNLVEVNCSAISDELFESELFGHVKGAFTGADTDKQGLFDYAQDGTLFLDEVGNLSASAQAKLLKILEDKKLRKVGAVTESDINVRVVAATNLDLTSAIEAGRFREDLYYRLNLLTVEIPPLRERPEDISCLVSHYLDFYATMYAKSNIKVSPSTIKAMATYHWPGNVRELCNVIERAVLLCQNSTIEPKDIKLALKKGRLSIADRQQLVINVPTHGVTLAEIEQQVVKQVLNLLDWNKTETAKFLGISRPRLRRIIEAGGLVQDRRQV